MNNRIKHCWISTFVLLIILFILSCVHSLAHYDQQVPLSAFQITFLTSVVIVPWGVLFLARTKYEFIAWCLLFLSALASFLYILVNHFILYQRDHSLTESGPYGWFFKITALLVTVVEIFRVWYAWKAISSINKQFN